MKNGIIIFFVLALFTLLSCSKDSGTNPNDDEDFTNAFITQEAQLAALWLTNEFTPPEDVAQQIANDLVKIRAEYADSIEIFNVNFLFPYWSGGITVGLTDSAVSAIRAGTYTAWDIVNDSLNIAYIDTVYLYGRVAYLNFQYLMNPVKVATHYVNLEGVRYANASSYFGDYSNFYPWYVDGRIAYLFRYGWGDCPAGCIYSHFWYIKNIDGKFEIIGDFSTENHDPFPDWWEEIKLASAMYWYQLTAD